MRLALYIKTMGVEPVPIQHTGYRTWAAALQQQYQKLRAKLDPAIGVRARISARTQMTKRTLSVAARGLVPDIPPAPHKPPPVKNAYRSGPDHKDLLIRPPQTYRHRPLRSRSVPRPVASWYGSVVVNSPTSTSSVP